MRVYSVTDINNGAVRGVKPGVGVLRTSALDKPWWCVLLLSIGCMPYSPRAGG